jgi:WD40 repeat protein
VRRRGTQRFDPALIAALTVAACARPGIGGDTSGPIVAPPLGSVGDGASTVEQSPSAVAISADGHYGAVGGRHGVEVFELPSLRRVRIFPTLRANGHGLALSGNGKRLVASGVAERTVEIWDVPRARRLDSLRFECMDPQLRSNAEKAHDRAPECEADAAAFSPDGRVIALGGTFLWLGAWDVEDGRWLWRKQSSWRGTVRSLAFSHDGHMLLSAAEADPGNEWSDSPRIWDTTTAAQIMTFSSDVRFAAWSPDEDAVIGDRGPSAIVWDRASAEERAALDHYDARAWAGPERVIGVALSADRRHAYSLGNDATLVEWDVATERAVRRLAVPGFKVHGGVLEAFASSRNGYALACDRSGRVWLWDLPNLAEIPPATAHH